jgi:thymidine kinase
MSLQTFSTDLILKLNTNSNYCPYARLQIEVVKCGNLSDIREAYKAYEVLAIDDAHLFSDVEFCENLAQDNKTVIVCALDGDHYQATFPEILKLVSQC